MSATLVPTTKPLERLATPEDARPHLTARPVLTMPDVLAMGRIRSEQTAGFSYNRSSITDEQQRRWWEINKDRLDCWLFDNDEGQTVGYGALRQGDDGRWWSSVAVRKVFAGKGHGRVITSWLVMQWPYEVWASARNDNPAAQLLHDRLLWDTLGCDNDLTFYRTKPKVRPAHLAVNLGHCGLLGQ